MAEATVRSRRADEPRFAATEAAEPDVTAPVPPERDLGFGNAVAMRMAYRDGGTDAAGNADFEPQPGLGSAATARVLGLPVAPAPPVVRPAIPEAAAYEPARPEPAAASAPQPPAREPQPPVPERPMPERPVPEPPVPQPAAAEGEPARPDTTAGVAIQSGPAPSARTLAAAAVAARGRDVSAVEPAPVSPQPEAVPTASVAIDGTSPGGILDQLAQTAPSTALAAFDQAEQASGPALEAQRQAVEEQLPEIPAPTGLPPTAPGAEARPAPEEQPVRPEGPPELAGAQTGREQPPMDPAAPERPAMGAQEAFEGVVMDAQEVPTSLGPRPAVDLTGEADPARMAAFEGDADAQVADARAAAAEGIRADHGLGTIHPEPTDEILSARRTLRGSGPLATQPGGGQAGPVQPDLAAGLDESLGSGLHERLDTKRIEYTEGELRFETDSAQAYQDADDQIALLKTEAAGEQQAARDQARNDVAGYQEEWAEEIHGIEDNYATKAGKAAEEHRGKIAAKRIEGEEKAAAQYDKAEQDAAAETRKAEAKAETEKARKREESGGFWGWAKRAASAFVDALKWTINAIYDGLRWVVKNLFEAAKQLALAAIELARMAIVGLIEAFGEVLKGLVSVALAAFPETAKRINTKIDGAVQVAVNGVNTAAKFLKKGVAGILDFLANTIDNLLALTQSLYNGIFTVLGMLIRGELKELIHRLGNIWEAAKLAPGKFETAAYEELLGGDFDQPLSPMELDAAGLKSPQAAASEPGQLPTSADLAGPIPTEPYTEKNVGVDKVVEGAELSAEATAELVSAGGEMLIAESASPDRTMAAVVAEATAARQSATAGEGAAQEQTRYPDDGLNPRRRAQVRWTLMKESLAAWWQEHKVAVIAGAVAAVLAIAALIFFSGGSIFAAVGPILSALGPLFIGITVATIAGHVRDFLAKAWDGKVEDGAKSLAKAAAAGAVELITWLTFKAGGALLRGGKALAGVGVRAVKAVGRAAKVAVKATARFLARVAKFVIRQGKVLFTGIKNFILKQFRRLKELGQALLKRLRFRGFLLIIEGTWWVLYGIINPLVKIAKGKLGSTGKAPTAKGVKAAKVPPKAAKAVKVGAKTGPKPKGTGPHNKKIEEVAKSVKDGQVIAGGQGPLPEAVIPTPGGLKSVRRPDILVRRPDGSVYGINVGKRSLRTGAMIKREAEAIADLEKFGDIEMHFAPYN